VDTSSNPALSSKAFARFDTAEKTRTMTVAGTLFKTGLALIVLILAAGWGWSIFPQFGTSVSWWVLWGGIFGTLLVGIWAALNANIINVLLYAALEGIYLGVVSRSLEHWYNGIVAQAVLITLTITLGMFFLYATGIVKVTRKLYSVVLIGTVGIVLYLIAEFFLSIIIPGFSNFVLSGPIGIIIALIIVGMASLNLLLDFDTITKGVQNKLAKRAEWYAAFGLMVTLIWLYISVLRLIAATRR
jgi:uncharacterized YccA/Bax inhibitor family protein